LACWVGNITLGVCISSGTGPSDSGDPSSPEKKRRLPLDGITLPSPVRTRTVVGRADVDRSPVPASSSQAQSETGAPTPGSRTAKEVNVVSSTFASVRPTRKLPARSPNKSSKGKSRVVSPRSSPEPSTSVVIAKRSEDSLNEADAERKREHQRKGTAGEFDEPEWPDEELAYNGDKSEGDNEHHEEAPDPANRFAVPADSPQDSGIDTPVSDRTLGRPVPPPKRGSSSRRGRKADK
jgi:hypothetical protein